MYYCNLMIPVLWQFFVQVWTFGIQNISFVWFGFMVSGLTKKQNCETKRQVQFSWKQVSHQRLEFSWNAVIFGAFAKRESCRELPVCLCWAKATRLRPWERVLKDCRLQTVVFIWGLMLKRVKLDLHAQESQRIWQTCSWDPTGAVKICSENSLQKQKDKNTDRSLKQHCSCDSVHYHSCLPLNNHSPH